MKKGATPPQRNPGGTRLGHEGATVKVGKVNIRKKKIVFGARGKTIQGQNFTCERKGALGERKVKHVGNSS